MTNAERLDIIETHLKSIKQLIYDGRDVPAYNGLCDLIKIIDGYKKESDDGR